MVRNGRHIEGGGGGGGGGSGGAPAQAQAQYGRLAARADDPRACSRWGATRSSPTSGTAGNVPSSSPRPSGRARGRAQEGPAHRRAALQPRSTSGCARAGAPARAAAGVAVELRQADLRDEIGWLARADALFVNN